MLELNRLARKGGAVIEVGDDSINVRLTVRGDAYLTLDALGNIVPIRKEESLSGMIVLVDVVVVRKVEKQEDNVAWQLAYARQNQNKSERSEGVTVRIVRTFAVSISSGKVFAHGEFAVRTTKDGLEVSRIADDSGAMKDIALRIIKPALLLPPEASEA